MTEPQENPAAPTVTSQPETAAGPPLGPPPPTGREDRSGRVTHVAAWVGIVAGALFIVFLVFLAGVLLGRQSAGDDGFGRWRYHDGFHHGGQQWAPGMGQGYGPGMCGPGGPGMYGPGMQGGMPPMMPGMQGMMPGMQGPGAPSTPSTTPPAPARP